MLLYLAIASCQFSESYRIGPVSKAVVCLCLVAASPCQAQAIACLFMATTFPCRAVAFPWQADAFPFMVTAFPFRAVAFPYRAVAFPCRAAAERKLKAFKSACSYTEPVIRCS